MTVSALQNWKGATTASSVASLTDVYTSIPTSGNVAMVFATRELGSGTLSISDDFGDGVGWTLIKGPIAAAAASPIIIYGWYKVVGMCTAKTVTITNSTNTSLAIYVAEYKSDVAGTWALNGTATSASGTSTTPDPTGIVCDATASVVVGYQSNDGGTATAVVNWTRQANDIVVSANSVEDRFVASAATYDPSWTGAPAATNWAAIGAALKSTPAAAAAADGRDASIASRPGGSMGPRMRRALVQRFPDSPAVPVELTQSPAAPFRPGRGPGKGPMLLRRNIVWPSAIFTPDVTLALTGVQAAGSVGTLGVQHDQALTGSEATASVGSLTPGTTVALNGVSGTGSVGTLAPSTDVAMTGVAGAASVGTLAPTNTVTLTGNEATVTIGTLTPDTSGDVTIALTGVSATAFVGDLTASGSDAAVVVVQQSVSAGGAYSTPIQDKYWRQIEQRYKKKKKQAEKKSERAVELVEDIAKRSGDLEEALVELKAELAEEHIRQSKVYVELLKLKLELAEADEEEEEAATLLASEEYRL